MTNKTKHGSPSSGAALIADYVTRLPERPGVYRMADKEGAVLYVGKARSLKKRVANYTHLSRLPYRLQHMVSLTHGMEFVTTDTEAEALLLEADFIKQYQPRFNILLRDDKSYPYIKLSAEHDYPRISKYRGQKKANAEYYGPFASVQAVREALTTLQRIFLLRPCSDRMFESRTRPCLQYQIKRCSAPCVGLISSKDYAAQVALAREFLSGKTAEVQQTLSDQMDTASREMRYEEAAHLRDRIHALSRIQSMQRVSLHSVADADVIGMQRDGGECCIQIFFMRGGQHYGNRSFFPAHAGEANDDEIMAAFISQFYVTHPVPRHLLLSHTADGEAELSEILSQKAGHKVQLMVPKRGDKQRAVQFAVSNASEALKRRLAESASVRTHLEALQRLFDLDDIPRRIEVYDNSHIMGTHAVGAMVVSGTEGLMPSYYRKYNIDISGPVKQGHVSGGDDYDMMRQVMRRRFKTGWDAQAEHIPDLLLIDGGKGQLSTVCDVLAERQIELPVVAISKGPDRHAGREQFHLPGQQPFSLPPGDATLHFLQRLRDEAHRFAIGSHRKRRASALVKSALDDIPGIGPKRKKALLHHFGSARGVEEATKADLLAIDGISQHMAEVIYGYFHPDV